jgi:hypothetical protein
VNSLFLVRNDESDSILEHDAATSATVSLLETAYNCFIEIFWRIVEELSDSLFLARLIDTTRPLGRRNTCSSEQQTKCCAGL